MSIFLAIVIITLLVTGMLTWERWYPEGKMTISKARRFVFFVSSNLLVYRLFEGDVYGRIFATLFTISLCLVLLKLTGRLNFALGSKEKPKRKNEEEVETFSHGKEPLEVVYDEEIENRSKRK